ncbi:hypothetical protein CA221_18345 [Sphingomonas koreensis]|nr:hypothetical protein CA221_18345 [Sphingomonas koreensis]
MRGGRARTVSGLWLWVAVGCRPVVTRDLDCVVAAVTSVTLGVLVCSVFLLGGADARVSRRTSTAFADLTRATGGDLASAGARATQRALERGARGQLAAYRPYAHAGQ